MLSVLKEANEQYERHYELKDRGYDLEKVQMRVTELLGVDRDRIYSSISGGAVGNKWKQETFFIIGRYGNLGTVQQNWPGVLG